ncbi:MAG TPA: FAD-binding oxidoreductase [Gammaproteobacteria bacterium]|nr:FAD-binding oxidoreductase [Gammaproteobacteria bacterium]
MGITAETTSLRIEGEVLAPGADGYDQARAVWNAMIDRKPALIARCLNSRDVSAALTFAAAQNLPVSIRGGGHNVAGHAVCDGGVMIDLSSMRGVSVDPEKRVAHVAGGATWGNVDTASQAHGLATPGGLISDTGVAGLTLSGGIGWLRSRYGLCIDNIVSVEIVTADGEIRRASETENADLFWAVRCGGGNFGVITELEFRLHSLGPEVMFCAPIYPLESGAEPIRFWRDFLAGKSDRIGSLVEFSTVPGESEDFPSEFWGKQVYTIAAVYAGDAEEGERIMQPLRELAPLATDFSGRMDYCEMQKLFDTLMPAGQFRCYWKSLYLGELSDRVIDDILEGVTSVPSPNSLSSIWNFGGATAHVAADATAFGDRSMPWMYSIDSVWEGAENDAANIGWTRDFWKRMQRYSDNGRMYLNFPGQGEEGEQQLEDTFGADNFRRLREIKAKYDPDNRFRFNQNIRPSSD